MNNILEDENYKHKLILSFQVFEQVAKYQHMTEPLKRVHKILVFIPNFVNQQRHFMWERRNGRQTYFNYHKLQINSIN